MPASLLSVSCMFLSHPGIITLWSAEVKVERNDFSGLRRAQSLCKQITLITMALGMDWVSTRFLVRLNHVFLTLCVSLPSKLRFLFTLCYEGTKQGRPCPVSSGVNSSVEIQALTKEVLGLFFLELQQILKAFFWLSIWEVVLPSLLMNHRPMGAKE